MYTKEVIFSKQSDLSGRNATNLVQIANRYQSGIWLEFNERRVNGKSLLGVLALRISDSAKVKIVTNGSDEVAAMNAVANYIEGNCED